MFNTEFNFVSPSLSNTIDELEIRHAFSISSLRLKQGDNFKTFYEATRKKGLFTKNKGSTICSKLKKLELIK
jgi:hypothetical protein